MTSAPQLKLKKGPKYCLGLVFLGLSVFSPFLIPVVTQLQLSTAAKTALSGVLLVGGPEVFGLIAVALLGKAAISHFIEKFKARLRWIAGEAPVGKNRYALGLAMLLLPMIEASVSAHFVSWRTIYGPYDFHAAIAWDVIWLASLFVLGTDFWDKIRGLFHYRARMVFPEASK